MRTENTTMLDKRSPENTKTCYTSFLAIQPSCKTSSNCQTINLTLININPEVKKHKCKKHENKNYQLLTILSIEDT